MASYPRQTLAAIAAFLAAGTIGAYTIASLIVSVVLAFLPSALAVVEVAL